MIKAWANCPYPPIPKEERVEQKSLAFCVSCNSLKRINFVVSAPIVGDGQVMIVICLCVRKQQTAKVDSTSAKIKYFVRVVIRFGIRNQIGHGNG